MRLTSPEAEAVAGAEVGVGVEAEALLEEDTGATGSTRRSTRTSIAEGTMSTAQSRSQETQIAIGATDLEVAVVEVEAEEEAEAGEEAGASRGITTVGMIQLSLRLLLPRRQRMMKIDGLKRI